MILFLHWINIIDSRRSVLGYNDKLCIVSHKEDLDGLVSAALLYSKLLEDRICKKNIDIYLVDYVSLSKVLENDSIINSKILFIADIGINKNFLKCLKNFKLLDKAPGEVKRYYFDHHKIAGDINSISKRIDTYFDFYINGEERGEKLCTSCIIYNYFHFCDEHFELLCEYAQADDYMKTEQYPNNRVVEQINMFIDYNQKNELNLVKIVKKMQTQQLWEEFYYSNIHNSDEIKKWQEQQIKSVIKNLVIINGDTNNIIISFAEYRAENIVYCLKRNISEGNIYIGFSVRDNYSNIQTNTDIANIIAAKFGGGGHPLRAGFVIPDEIRTLISRNEFSKVKESFFIITLNEIIMSKH